MDSMSLFYPEGHEMHNFYAHPERPERVEVIKNGLKSLELWDHSTHVSPLVIDQRILDAVHEPEYLMILERASNRAQNLDPDTYTTIQSWQLALNAAGGAAAIGEHVWDRKSAVGFALARPPGHHATKNRGMGFCLINNVAVAAEYLLQKKGVNKVAILDLDLHHGNGTQDIFWERPEVCYISIHQAPFYPGTGALSEIGSGAGEGTTLNLPIPQFSGDEAYSTLCREIVLPYLEDQKADMLLVSYGFDTHWRDPLGSMLVSAGTIYMIIADLREWANEKYQGRMAVFLEGGYDLEAGMACGQAVGAALTGMTWVDPLGKSSEDEKDDWKETLSGARDLLGF